MKIRLPLYISMALLLFAVARSNAQNGSSISVDEYISMYKDLAVADMKKFGIPASIKLAQGILESGSGNSELARKANNHFGIKCHKGWRGKSFRMDDDEKNECFRKYRKPEDSYHDHSMFLTTRDRYAGLFKLQVTDYKSWAYGLKAAGYATNPRYPELLIKIIEKNQLHRFDNGNSRLEALATDDIGSGNTVEDVNAAEVVDYREVFSDSPVVYKSERGRPVYENNSRKFIFIKSGDNFYSIAGEFQIYAWQLWKYNELDKKQTLKEDDILYLEKKRRRAAKGNKTHVVQPGETMACISQVYGIKLKRLYRMNDLTEGTRPAPGEELRLR